MSGDSREACSAGSAEPIDFRSVQWMAQEFGDKWSLPILSRLRDGPLRFLQLKRALGPVSQRMLTRTLKKLERVGVVSRTCSEGSLLQVTYDLTSGGVVLVQAVQELNRWMIEHGEALQLQRRNDLQVKK